MINIIPVFCEGPHDAAFLSKILKANSFKSNDDTKISEFPEPYNNLLQNEAKKSDVYSLNLQEIRRVMIPSTSLIYGNNYIFLYAMGGVSAFEKRKKLLNQINDFIPKSDYEIDILPSNTMFTVLYFLDADNLGVESRLNEINSEIKQVIKEFDYKNPTSIYKDKLSIGSYIFTDHNEKTGKLEDIILPIMTQNNDEIFKSSKSFIKENFSKERVKKNNFDEKKSIINVAGQLQKSGASNVVCISQTDYLSVDKILQSIMCKNIFDFVKRFLVS